MQKKHTLSTVFISTAAQGVKKNNVFTQSIFSRARATTSLLWSPGSALSPLIKQSFGMAFSSSFIHSTRYCEVKILWKNLDCLCRLPTCCYQFSQRALWPLHGSYLSAWLLTMLAEPRGYLQYTELCRCQFVYEGVRELLIMLWGCLFVWGKWAWNPFPRCIHWLKCQQHYYQGFRYRHEI